MRHGAGQWLSGVAVLLARSGATPSLNAISHCRPQNRPTDVGRVARRLSDVARTAARGRHVETVGPHFLAAGIERLVFDWVFCRLCCNRQLAEITVRDELETAYVTAIDRAETSLIFGVLNSDPAGGTSPGHRNLAVSEPGIKRGNKISLAAPVGTNCRLDYSPGRFQPYR